MAKKKKAEEGAEDEASAAKGAEGEGGEEGEGGHKKGKKKLIFIAGGGLVVVLIVVGLLLSGVLGGGSKEKKEGDEQHTEEASEEGGHGEETASEEGGHGEEAASEEGGHGEEGGEGKKGKVAGINKPVYYELPEFLVNLNTANSRVSFLKMSVTMELKDLAAIQTMDANKPKVMDTFNTYLRELRATDIQGSAGIYRLRDELMTRVNATVGDGVVKDILFGEIIVQ